MLHCSNCGGKFGTGQLRCSYCSAEIKHGERGFGPACPECFATTIVGAKHCSGCGLRLEAQSVLRALSDRPCPRCKNALSECATDAVRYIECTACGGLWLDESHFRNIVAAGADPSASVIPHTREGVPQGPTVEAKVRYLPCPVCTQLMTRRNFASVSGIILDWCRGHGWWFDSHEIERVLAFVEKGGLEKSRAVRHENDRRELERLKQQISEARAGNDLRHRIPPARSTTTFLEMLIESLM